MKQVQTTGVLCHICGHENSEAADCAVCGANLAEPGSERVVLAAPLRATFATADKISAVAVNASAWLTDKRLVLVPLKLSGRGLTGMLTAAVVNKMTSKNGVVSLPLDCVTAVRDGRFGLLVQALLIDTRDGELVKMTVPKRKEWKTAILSAAVNAR